MRPLIKKQALALFKRLLINSKYMTEGLPTISPGVARTRVQQFTENQNMFAKSRTFPTSIMGFCFYDITVSTEARGKPPGLFQ